ncbi:MAG: 16S rRNA (guanine(527)-N(7))-methyltransferase RsmG [Planctomycetota bacterium]
MENRATGQSGHEPPPADPLSREEFHSRCRAALEGWAPDYSLGPLSEHAWRVRDRNRTMNLTRIVEPEEMARKHIIDSLAALPLFQGAGEGVFEHVLDLGTGAGFPGLSLALALPPLQVTLLDSTRKKVDFLQSVVDDFGIGSRVRCVWSRFEDHIRPNRRRYDAVLARAVGPVERILGWTTNRWFGPTILWKGPAVDDELKAVSGLLWKREMMVAVDEAYSVPGDDTVRRLLLLDTRKS